MSNDSFWLCVEGIADTLDGSREQAELQVTALEGDLRQMSPTDRLDMRGKLILIVAQLSRLEMRMTELDGPARKAV